MAKRRNTATIEQKAYGDEPVWSSDEFDSEKIIVALNWYTAMQSKDDSHKYLIEYVKQHDNENLKFARKIPKAANYLTIGFALRMKMRGAIFQEKQFDNIMFGLRDLYVRYAGAADVVEKEKVKKPTVQDRIREQAGQFANNIDYAIDEFIESGYKSKYSTYEFLKANDVKQPHCKIIAEEFEPLLDELITAWNGDDPEIVEAYQDFSDKELGRFVDFVQSIIDDCKLFASNSKKVRAPRKKKGVNMEKIIERLKYKKEDTSLKVASVDPRKIIGANQVWLFNTKYRILQVLNADGPSGMSIKGMSIKGFDESSSVMKTVRKPEDVLKKVLSGGKIVLRKIMDEINSKERVSAGRLNDQTLIVRVE